MNRIGKKFAELKRIKKKAFIAYITAGDPDMRITERLVLELAANGADIIELGVPFSDPLADGPTIQRASQRALRGKINIKMILSLVKRLRRATEVPIVLMPYYNTVLRYGVKRFVKEASAAGVDGVIVPDLPVEEAGELMSEARRRRLATIFLVAPTTTRERIRHIAKASSGFIYYVSLTGVTGARKSLPKDIISSIKAVKRLSAKPVCVGFGISTPEQVRDMSKTADGVIVGSAIIKIIEDNMGRKGLVKKAGLFVKRIACYTQL
ncbi:MAG: tryptophan synthase subunit alpha [Candidatus Omnitrophica bacterium CG1_02_49_10]|nr:MAG: tryptophan synthase subunit alpha [Candidatus Omnitrophica bacterium CG1_02_49_10]